MQTFTFYASEDKLANRGHTAGQIGVIMSICRQCLSLLPTVNECNTKNLSFSFFDLISHLYE